MTETTPATLYCTVCNTDVPLPLVDAHVANHEAVGQATVWNDRRPTMAPLSFVTSGAIAFWALCILVGVVLALVLITLLG